MITHNLVIFLALFSNLLPFSPNIFSPFSFFWTFLFFSDGLPGLILQFLYFFLSYFPPFSLCSFQKVSLNLSTEASFMVLDIGQLISKNTSKIPNDPSKTYFVIIF